MNRDFIIRVNKARIHIRIHFIHSSFGGWAQDGLMPGLHVFLEAELLHLCQTLP